MIQNKIYLTIINTSITIILATVASLFFFNKLKLKSQKKRWFIRKRVLYIILRK